MADIQKIIRGYNTKDVYNINKIGFNQKAVLNNNLGIL